MILSAPHHLVKLCVWLDSLYIQCQDCRDIEPPKQREPLNVLLIFIFISKMRTNCHSLKATLLRLLLNAQEIWRKEGCAGIPRESNGIHRNVGFAMLEAKGMRVTASS